MNLFFSLFLILCRTGWQTVKKETIYGLKTLALDEMEASVSQYFLHHPLAEMGKLVSFASEISTSATGPHK